MENVLSHFVNGKKLTGEVRVASPLVVHNPATGEVLANVPVADQELVNQTVEHALAAFEKWAYGTTPLNRARILFKFKELLESNRKELAELITREHGKVLDDAEGEITRGLEVVEFACGIPHLLKGELSSNVGRGIDCLSMRQPLGVVAGVTPFNFPVMVPLWMFPIALACGNCFVLKPSEKDPSAALFMADLLQKAGLPDGVFNVLQGDRTTVEAILQHPDLKALSFVGSTPVAKYLYENGTSRKGDLPPLRVQALGGAKNHLVAMPDADLDQVTKALIGAAYGAAGERCMAISVAVAVTDEYGDALVENINKNLKDLKVGAGTDIKNHMGPLISSAHQKRVLGLIEQGVNEGAKLIYDGRDKRPREGATSKGYFVGPCLFDHVSPEMEIYKEEIFGPVLCVVRVPTYEAALELIHNCPYANGTALYTQNAAVARHFKERVHVGMVGVNIPIPVPMAFMSFGGHKASLFGDHHIYGEEGVRFYTRYKAVTEKWPVDKESEVSFTMPTLK